MMKVMIASMMMIVTTTMMATTMKVMTKTTMLVINSSPSDPGFYLGGSEKQKVVLHPFISKRCTNLKFKQSTAIIMIFKDAHMKMHFLETRKTNETSLGIHSPHHTICHHQQGRIAFNTVNPSLSTGKDFLIHFL